MNDHSATEPATEPATPPATRQSHPELARRLDLVADTTTVDVDAAWESIQVRLAAIGQDQARRRRVLLAVAAALLVVLGATAILLRSRDDGRIRTVDRSTTTDPTTTSSPNRRSTTSTTTTSTPPGADRSSVGSSDGAVTDLVPGTGSPGGGSSTGPADPGTGGPGGSVPPAAPARLAPIATTWSSQYEVELVHAGGHVYFRRVDGVGATPGPPDGHGYVDQWTPGGISGTGCLATSGGAYEFPDAAPERFIWGLAGSGIASITIHIPGQPGTYTGPALPLHGGSDLRAWVINLPPGPVERIEGSDASANVVATITNPADGYSGSAGC